jgi:hypothetical protein
MPLGVIARPTALLSIGSECGAQPLNERYRLTRHRSLKAHSAVSRRWEVSIAL